MKCPECNAWTEVLETRGPWRRRQCANLHRFNTLETQTKIGPSSFRTKKDESSSTKHNPSPSTKKPAPLA
jgi:transcriptional regulator NrdR family protein